MSDAEFPQTTTGTHLTPPFPVVPADAEDVDALLALRDDAARWLTDRGVVQWAPGEFPRSLLAERVDAGRVWVVRVDNALAGTVTVLWEDPSVWGADGAATSSAGYIHTLVTERRLAGPGTGAWLLKWAEDHIASTGRSLARLDCVADNARLRAYYESAGYRHLRVVSVPPPWSPTALFEKQVGHH